MSIRLSWNEATRILDKETAEYVTSRYILCAGIHCDWDAMTIYDVSLAMKIRGDGTLYIDVVKDETENQVLQEKALPVFLGDYKVSARLLLGTLYLQKAMSRHLFLSRANTG